jgi:hypothetical protein
MPTFARLVAGLTIALAMTAGHADATVKIGGAAHHVKIWIPEYYGGAVYADTFDYTVTPFKFTQKVVNVKTRSCNPNSVAVHGGKLYILCNSDFGGKDQVLVYNATTYAYIKTITGLGADGKNYFTGSSLIGSVFDTHGNLWLSGYNGNDLLRISAGELASTTSKVDRQVVDSPDSPAGLAIDGSDGSFWVVGQFAGGIALNFPDSVLNQAGTFLGASALNPSPSYCISDSAGTGCQNVAGLFDAPEGVAVFDGGVWVSNNGGNAPTGTIVELKKKATAGQLSSAKFGSMVGKPFSCPGGMFSASVSGGTATLWVNDEGYGIANTDCGASAADQGDQLGRVLEFLPNDLLKHRTQPVPEAFTDAARLKTASPGFGGMFVQMD